MGWSLKLVVDDELMVYNVGGGVGCSGGSCPRTVFVPVVNCQIVFAMQQPTTE